ncbi:uncharacterized protein EAF02_003637 [Botrytis sinoallii]|uniref:uncharacterized protein n=1 Tax=Botrytis sinoallii TaxID=1463999 RepID=UPI0019006642|nr:uncharacterized protein EAF02_003637 [Botrytis sinoallii]KAF7886990.1 hypothetical protein EAF02_003637 [Botrytis sinoallii]
MPPRRPNIAGDFDKYFGNVSDLRNWQQLCADVRIPRAWNLGSINACRKVGLRSVDLVVWEEERWVGIGMLRSGDWRLETRGALQSPRQYLSTVGLLSDWCSRAPFSTRDELLAYTIKKHKFYPLSEAKKGGPVRGLLFKRG